MAESMLIIGSLRDAPPSSGTISAALKVLGPAEASKLTVPFVLGASLVVASGIIRAQCYRALGPYFTFKQCICKDHKLITTGPYAVVRHPGYLGLLMSIFGSGIMYAEPGSWLQKSGMLNVRWVKVAATVMCLINAASIVTLICRPGEEDRYLSERFGQEWEDWAGRVKYKLVPFVY
ncbi:hypothetical protein J3R83DRAFT_12543 [Lanmaoa asiatica]|nr:hypothetical protein J3R83DRAFT_12543 [Lanmaoa asiatica]